MRVGPHFGQKCQRLIDDAVYTCTVTRVIEDIGSFTIKFDDDGKTEEFYSFDQEDIRYFPCAPYMDESEYLSEDPIDVTEHQYHTLNDMINQSHDVSQHSKETYEAKNTSSHYRTADCGRKSPASDGTATTSATHSESIDTPAIAPHEPYESNCNVCNSLTKFRCGICLKVFYCSRRCQRKDWFDHKQGCRNNCVAIAKGNIKSRPTTSPLSSVQNISASLESVAVDDSSSFNPEHNIGYKIDKSCNEKQSLSHDPHEYSTAMPSSDNGIYWRERSNSVDSVEVQPDYSFRNDIDHTNDLSNVNGHQYVERWEELAYFNPSDEYESSQDYTTNQHLSSFSNILNSPVASGFTIHLHGEKESSKHISFYLNAQEVKTLTNRSDFWNKTISRAVAASRVSLTISTKHPMTRSQDIRSYARGDNLAINYEWDEEFRVLDIYDDIEPVGQAPKPSPYFLDQDIYGTKTLKEDELRKLIAKGQIAANHMTNGLLSWDEYAPIQQQAEEAQKCLDAIIQYRNGLTQQQEHDPRINSKSTNTDFEGSSIVNNSVLFDNPDHKRLYNRSATPPNLVRTISDTSFPRPSSPTLDGKVVGLDDWHVTNTPFKSIQPPGTPTNIRQNSTPLRSHGREESRNIELKATKEKISQIQEILGDSVPSNYVAYALDLCYGNVERAIDYLFTNPDPPTHIAASTYPSYDPLVPINEELSQTNGNTPTRERTSIDSSTFGNGPNFEDGHPFTEQSDDFSIITPLDDVD